MSYGSMVVNAGLFAAIVAVSVAPLHAQVKRPLPARPQIAKRPLVVIAPRVYTASTFRARLMSLRGGPALIARANAAPSRTTPAGSSAPSGGPPPSSAPDNTQPNTTWNTGIGAIGSVTTLSAAHPEAGNANVNGLLQIEQGALDLSPGQTTVVQGTRLNGLNFLSGPGTGSVMFYVIFDFYASGAYPDSVTIRGGNVPSTCTASDLQASTSGNVVSCATTISGQFDEDYLIPTPSGRNGLLLVDVSVMRVR